MLTFDLHIRVRKNYLFAWRKGVLKRQARLSIMSQGGEIIGCQSLW